MKVLLCILFSVCLFGCVQSNQTVQHPRVGICAVVCSISYINPKVCDGERPDIFELIGARDCLKDCRDNPRLINHVDPICLVEFFADLAVERVFSCADLHYCFEGQSD